MLFKNIYAFQAKLPEGLKLNEQLSKFAFQPCGAQDALSSGWLNLEVNNEPSFTLMRGKKVAAILLHFGIETKSVPASLVNRELKVACKEHHEKEGFQPSKQQKKDLREQIFEQLLSKALPRLRVIPVMILPTHDLLLIDSPSMVTIDLVLGMIIRQLTTNVASIHTTDSPVALMTQALKGEEDCTGEFFLGKSATIVRMVESSPTIKYKNTVLDTSELAKTLDDKDQVTQLELVGTDFTFQLTDGLQIKGIKPTPELKELMADNSNSLKQKGLDPADEFAGTLLLAADAMYQLWKDVIEMLGGYKMEDEVTHD